jgi:predicted phosphoribosyltransferase
MIIHEKELYNRFHVFRNRDDAGEQLASFISKNIDLSKEDSVLAIPAGGVPVACRMAKKLGLILRLIPVSKILFPWTTEAGFGAINVFGDVILNERAIEAFGLGEDAIKKQIEETRKRLRKRIEIIPEHLLQLGGRRAILVDDGLASGYTMLAAIKGAERFYDSIVASIPTASERSLRVLERECEVIAVLNVRDIYPFAVADAYVEWKDVDEAEMIGLLSTDKS